MASVLCVLVGASATGEAAVIREVRVDGEPTSRPAATTRPGLSNKLAIRVMGSNWGAAGKENIRRVLESASGELWKNFPGRRLHPIIVQRSSRAPITLYRRGPGGEYLVKVTPQDRFWCQFAYQFSHEFFHILSNYSYKTPRTVKWFEESLCEMAAIYALKQMAITWKTSPPYSHGKDYAKDIEAYADDLQKPADKLPKGKTLARWYKENSAALRKAPWLRDKNRIVANSLLGVFEEHSGDWIAIGYLNTGKPASDSLQDYLANWYLQTPVKHRKLVGRIIRMFEFKIPEIPKGK